MTEIACTLGTGEMKSRVGEWQRALGFVSSRTPLEGGLRLTLSEGAPVGEIATLVAAEQTCCSFFRFAITVDERGVGLEVRAPAEAAGVVASLFGEPEHAPK